MSDLNVVMSTVIMTAMVLWILFVLNEGLRDGSKLWLVYFLALFLLAVATIVIFLAVSFILHTTLGI